MMDMVFSLQTVPGIVKVIDYEINRSYLALLEEWLDVCEIVNITEV